MEKIFTIKGVFNQAYALMKPKFWKIIGQYAVIIVVFILLNILLGGKSSGPATVTGLLFGNLILPALFIFCSVVFGFSYVNKGSFSLKDISAALTLKKFGYFILIYIITMIPSFISGALSAFVVPSLEISIHAKSIAIITGLLLFAVLCIIFALRISLMKFIVVEKESTPIRALVESIKITKGHGWKLLGFVIALILVNILGAVCLMVGLLFTIPLTVIAYTIVYKKLSGGTIISVSKEAIPANTISAEATAV